MLFLLFSMVHKGRAEGSQQNGIAGSPLLVSQFRTCRRTCSLEPTVPQLPHFPLAPSGVAGHGFLGPSKQGYLFLHISGAKIILCFNTFFCGRKEWTSALSPEETQNYPHLDTPNF